MTATARIATKLRAQDGVGLVELLIALLVLNVGIFATIGAFASAATTLRRASHISTAAAIADKEMEALRNTAYAGLPTTTQTIASWPSSPDGRSYKVVVTPVSSGAQSSNGSTAVKVMQVQVSDNGDNNRLLVTSTSTFSHCNQAGLGTGTDPNPCQS